MSGNGHQNEEGALAIDGSHGEGGGQIIRNGVTLACILGEKISVSNIRANRPNPGLASQHLESIKAMLRLSGATTKHEPRKQDTCFVLDGSMPSNTVPLFQRPGVDTTIDLRTAGSCTLCVQCILPYLLCLKSPSRIRIIGGTTVMKSPSFDYFYRIFLPTLNSIMGTGRGKEGAVKAWLNCPGYYPRGGGCIEIEVNPLSLSSSSATKFPTFSIGQRGAISRVEAILNIPHELKNSIPEFKQKISQDMDIRNIEVRTVPFASVEYFVYCESSQMGFSHLVEGKRVTAPQVHQAIDTVQQEFKEFMKTDGAVDQHLQDQLIIYMALAKWNDDNDTKNDKSSSNNKVSTIKTCSPLTDHTTSAIHVAQLFSPDKWTFQLVPSSNDNSSIEIRL